MIPLCMSHRYALFSADLPIVKSCLYYGFFWLYRPSENFLTFTRYDFSWKNASNWPYFSLVPKKDEQRLELLEKVRKHKQLHLKKSQWRHCFTYKFFKVVLKDQRRDWGWGNKQWIWFWSVWVASWCSAYLLKFNRNVRNLTELNFVAVS